MTVQIKLGVFMDNYKMIKFEIRDKIAFITLNRPDAANGLNSLLAKELSNAALQCDVNEGVKVVVLTGTGKFFSAGGDINEMNSHGGNVTAGVKALTDDLHHAVSTFARMDAPVIIAVNGVAAGAGFSLAIAGDVVIAAESAAFTMAYTKVGLTPDGSASYFLPRLIGIRKSMELMLLNKTLTAQEALEWGLLNQVVPDDSLMAVAEEIATKLASGPLSSHGIVKKLLLSSFDNSLETQMELEGRYISKSTSTKNGQEGISAFLEKRKPNFT